MEWRLDHDSHNHLHSTGDITSRLPDRNRRLSQNSIHRLRGAILETSRVFRRSTSGGQHQRASDALAGVGRASSLRKAPQSGDRSRRSSEACVSETQSRRGGSGHACPPKDRDFSKAQSWDSWVPAQPRESSPGTHQPSVRRRHAGLSMFPPGLSVLPHRRRGSSASDGLPQSRPGTDTRRPACAVVDEGRSSCVRTRPYTRNGRCGIGSDTPVGASDTSSTNNQADDHCFATPRCSSSSTVASRAPQSPAMSLHLEVDIQRPGRDTRGKACGEKSRHRPCGSEVNGVGSVGNRDQDFEDGCARGRGGIKTSSAPCCVELDRLPSIDRYDADVDQQQGGMWEESTPGRDAQARRRTAAAQPYNPVIQSVAERSDNNGSKQTVGDLRGRVNISDDASRAMLQCPERESSGRVSSGQCTSLPTRTSARDRGTDYDPATRRQCLVGLQNLGNTCYMNACLQCLLHTDELVELCRRGLQREHLCRKSPTRGALAEAFGELIRSVEASTPHSSVSPAQIKRLVSRYAPHFSGYGQQDSQEFLRFFLDGLAEDLKRPRPHSRATASVNSLTQPGRRRTASPGHVQLTEEAVAKLPVNEQADWAWERHLADNDSDITNTFCGQLQSRISCSSCGNISYCFDPFFDLSVPVPRQGSTGKKKVTGGEAGIGSSRRRSRSCSGAGEHLHGSTSVEACTLEDCLEAFIAEELLDGDNKPVCARCQKRQRSVKCLVLHRLPPVLVIHLKRFQYACTSREKLLTAVDFPLEGLDMASYSACGSVVVGGDGDARDSPRRVGDGRKGRHTYELYGVCNHMGGLEGGHYTAHCREASGVSGTGQWFTFDDTRVSCTDITRIGGATAYVLFYRRTP